MAWCHKASETLIFTLGCLHSGDDATSVIEAGYSLCPDQLTSTFSQALIESGDNHHGEYFSHVTQTKLSSDWKVFFS